MGIEPCRWSGRSGEIGSNQRSNEPRSGCWWRSWEVDWSIPPEIAAARGVTPEYGLSLGAWKRQRSDGVDS